MVPAPTDSDVYGINLDDLSSIYVWLPFGIEVADLFLNPLRQLYKIIFGQLG